LFGATPERSGGEWKSLDFRSAGGVEISDYNLTTPSPVLDGSAAPVTQRSGGVGAVASANLQFVRQTSTSELMAGGRGVFREYFDQPVSYGATSLIAQTKYRATPVTRVSYDVSGSVAREPYFLALPPGFYETPEWLVNVPATPYAAFLKVNESVYGRAGFEYRPTKRSSVGASVNGQSFRFPQFPMESYATVGFQGQIRQNVTRDFGLHLGYGRQDYRSRAETPDYVHEYLDVGVDYNREFSIARRTRLQFATMTGMIRQGDAKEYRIEGFVSLAKSFNRTWHAEIAVNRRTDFLPGLFAPVFSDTAHLRVGGQFAPRLQWALTASGGQGRAGIESDSTFVTAVAATRLSLALTRTLGSYVQYHYFYYDALPDSLAVYSQLGKSSRQSVTFGLNVWVPLYERMKVIRDPE
jgi:hypothetical protein